MERLELYFGKQTRIIYLNLEDSFEARYVIPLYLSYITTPKSPDKRIWCLETHDLERGARRTYPMDRIHLPDQAQKNTCPIVGS